jgi:hypothetical protein
MVFWSDISARMALAVLGIAMLIAFAPSSASAHGGHVHPSALMHIDAPTVSDAPSSAGNRIVEVSAAQVPLAADHGGYSDCDDRGCCANGHCGSFCGVIAPALFAVFGTAKAPLELRRNASPPVSLATDGPARPPKSIA